MTILQLFPTHGRKLDHSMKVHGLFNPAKCRHQSICYCGEKFTGWGNTKEQARERSMIELRRHLRATR